MKKFYLSATILFFALNTFAQHWGYVVTAGNDTIHCAKVKAAFLTHVIKYKANDNDDFKSVNTGDIKEYQLSNDSSVWRAEVLKPGEFPIFLRVEVDGKICLYQEIITTSTLAANSNYINPNYNTTSTTNWYVSKDNAPLIALKTTALFVIGASHDDRKAALAEMFADNPQVAAEYKADDSFRFKKIKKYVQQYDHDAAVNNHH